MTSVSHFMLQSLKKEVDWDRGDDNRSTAGESSVEYRHSHDLVSFKINSFSY